MLLSPRLWSIIVKANNKTHLKFLYNVRDRAMKRIIANTTVISAWRLHPCALNTFLNQSIFFTTLLEQLQRNDSDHLPVLTLLNRRHPLAVALY